MSIQINLGMGCSTAWWRLLSKRPTRIAAAIQATSFYQTIHVMGTLSDALNKFSIIWVLKELVCFKFQPLLVEKKQCPLIFIGKYHEVEDRGMKKTCMAACRDQTFSASVYTTRFPSEENYNHRQGFCLIVRWI